MANNSKLHKFRNFSFAICYNKNDGVNKILLFAITNEHVLMINNAGEYR